MSNVAVIGYGYVGSSIAKSIADAGHSLLVIDTNPNIDCEYPLYHDYSALADVDFAIVCVPTPLTEAGSPDTSMVTSACIEASLYMPDLAILIVESTVPIGYTKQIETIINRSIVFSPERIDPNNSKWGISNTPKVVASNNSNALKYAYAFYKTFVDTVVAYEDTNVAEAAKLLENSYRLINISFINEYAMLMDRLGINANAVIDLAATKPHGFARFNPGIGAGGHCIPVDPMFLMSHGTNLKMLSAANQVNSNDNIEYYVDELSISLKGLTDKKIVVIGIAYKPNINDVRESSSIKLINKLRSLGAKVFWHDDVVGEYNGEHSVSDFSSFDAAIITQRHNGFDDAVLLDLRVVIDCERKI